MDINSINSISEAVGHDNVVLRTYINDKGELDWKVVTLSTEKIKFIGNRRKRNSEIIRNVPSESKYHHLKLVCGFILLTIISMTIGIIVVCLTAPNHSDDGCVLKFKRTVKPVITYDASPEHVAVGDFNKDNRSDLVIANSGTHTISIILNDNNHELTMPMKYSTGQGSIPCWVAIGQLNNDTALDIIVANYGMNNIGIFLGYDNGTFADQITFSLNASRPLSLAVEDFNNDTYLDIVVVNNGTFNLILLLGHGNGSFYKDSQYNMGYDSMPRALAVTDFNDDLRPDIVIVNYGTSDITIGLNSDNGTFLMSKYSTGRGSNPCSVTVGDFDNDYYIDIAVVNRGTKTISIFIGNGDGTFIYTTPFSIGSQTNPKFIVTGLITADLTNLDLIVANAGEDNIILFEGDGNGNFAWKGYQSTGYNSNPSSMAILYFNNDSKTDVVVTNFRNNYVIVFTSFDYSIGMNQITTSTGQDSYPNSVAVGDFNNDSWLDIVVANLQTNNFCVFFGSNDSNYQVPVNYSIIWDASEPCSVSVGDLNNDTYLDIAIATYGLGTIELYFGQGNGSFEYYDTLWLSNNDFYPDVIAMNDLNSDTYIDIVATSCDNDGLLVLLGNGDGTFQDGQNYSTAYNSCPIYVSIADFNEDDLLDFASANYGAQTVSIFINNGNGTFVKSRDILIKDYYPVWLVIGDLNKDQYEDIVIVNPDHSNIGILLGNGDGTFRDIYNYSTGFSAEPSSAVIGDFNMDNNMDIAVANAQTSDICIFAGNGNGRFPSLYVLSVINIYYPQSMATADFDKDGQADLVLGDTGTNDITVLFLEYLTKFNNQKYSNQGSASHQYFITSVDFKNDQQMDIVVVNSGNDTVQLLIGYQNNGTFISNITHSTGLETHPRALITGDFNRDNHPDVAIADSYADRIVVLILSENDTLLRLHEYFTGLRSLPNSLAVGDLNKDGWLDLVVANNNTDNIGVFFGYDYLTFRTITMTGPRPASNPYYIITGDFNNDSQCDLVIAYQQIDTISVFLNTRNSTFPHQSFYSIDQSSQPVALAAADFNNDNYLDIATANSNGKTISILFGYSNGTFTLDSSYSTGSTSPVSIAVGDFNNDTKQDLVVANSDGDNIGIFIGYGNGSFADQVSYRMSNKSSPVWVVVSDFNNDNISDIAVANNGRDGIGIYLGYGNGTFQNMMTYSTGNNSRPSSIDVGDFNKDGCMDIAVANQRLKNVGIIFGDCHGAFLRPVTYATNANSYLFSIKVKDLNNDTLLDIVVADWGSGYGNVGVLYGMKNGTFLVPKVYSTGFNSEPTSIAFCDFNNDGRLDMAVAKSDMNTISIMFQNGTEPFGIQTTYSTGGGSSPYSVNVTDIDNDERLDILVVNFKTSTIGLFYGYGNGSFENQITYSSGNDSRPTFITSGYINDDKYIDIIIANAKSCDIGILYGYGNRTFTSLQTHATGESSDPTSLALGDLNKDNHTDIVVTNYGINSVLVFYGYGNKTFREPLSISFNYGDSPIAATIGDYNNDSLLDIAVANYGTGYVEVLLQIC